MASEPGWATLTPFTPGTDPIAALSQELAHAAGSTPSGIRRQLGKDKSLVLTVENFLRTAFSPPRRRLLIVIDQFEEILTRSSATGRAQLAAMLPKENEGFWTLLYCVIMRGCRPAWGLQRIRERSQDTS